MKALVYDTFPEEAKEIREEIFIREQGFQNELDEIDNEAVHIVLYDDNKCPIATCRIFWNTLMNAYTLGRLAVVKEYRGKNIGSISLCITCFFVFDTHFLHPFQIGKDRAYKIPDGNPLY